MEIVKTASLYSVAELQHAKIREEALVVPTQEPALPRETPSRYSNTQASTTAITSPEGKTTHNEDAGEAILLMNVWDSSDYSRRSLPSADSLPPCGDDQDLSVHARADNLNAYAKYILEAMH